MSSPEAILVDARNFDSIFDKIVGEMKSAALIGFDIETQDDNRHAGLDRFMKVDPKTRKKSPGKKLVFDTRRTIVTGFSLYPDKGPNSYYVNLAHADTKNRVPWSKAKTLLDAKPAESCWVAHNAPYELTMMHNSLGYDLGKVICTMQMAVSAYNADEYNVGKLMIGGLGGIEQLLQPVSKAFVTFDPAKGRDSMTPEQAELFAKVVAKESDSDWSWNGYVDSIAYGYGLKQAIASWFGYKMRTFEETLGDKAHMGQLTGEEVVAYGADDAFWAVALYHVLLNHMLQNCPTAVGAFFNQENPMVPIYSETWRAGMKVNLPAVESRKAVERAETAKVLRRLKAAVNRLLPFKAEPHDGLIKYDKWYVKGHANYRNQIAMWAQMPDVADDYAQVQQARGAVANAWASERGDKESSGPNLSHYMPVRTLIYDLIGTKLIVEKGKTQSDSEARGRLQIRLEKEGGREDALEVIQCLAALAGIEQRMKLYLTPYSMLTDPETGRIYPVLSSQLASRRMATSFPNPMQLAKRGESTYVRGFYEPDEEDHVIVSSDWSSIELVEIGDFSGDPEFKKAFGQIPYEDLHAGAAAAVLSVEVEDLTEESFKAIKSMSSAEIADLHPRLRTNLKGEAMDDGKKIVGYWRTEIGKGSNFNYWYSGALSTVAARMGWGSDKMWEATDKYRKRFEIAEAWRVATIEKACRDGYVMLPDGHRRVKFEVTDQWRDIMWAKFGFYNNEAITKFGNEVVKAIYSRAKNQVVNSLIQGTCATLAKRSIFRLNAKIKEMGFRARFMIPIHDELLYSVHKDEVLDFIPVMKGVMKDHPDIIKTLPINCTTAIGRTFEPFDAKKVPLGQIEIDEAPAVDWLPDNFHGKSLDRVHQQKVLDYLFSQQPLARAA